MIKLNRKNIDRYHRRILHRAQKMANQRDVESAAAELFNASTLAYNFNYIYRDDTCERLIHQISKLVLGEQPKKFQPHDNKIVFFDAFSLDNRGLTQQYIRGLIASGCEFLYIFGGGFNAKQSTDIRSELDAYYKATVFEIQPDQSYTDRINQIYQIIAEYSPSKALLHLAPWSVDALAAFSGMPEVSKFNINLTDHAFWLGSSIIDYNIEFRDYGATVSTEKRGFSPNQLIKLPYYPITSQKEFQGFPNIAKGKIVIFSGGAAYKVYGENGTFFDIVKRLLDENLNAVLLFAGGGDMCAFEKFITNNKLQNRIALIGNRSDINQVFQHADIYLGTYPFTGGLMAQFAAVNGIPIIAYTHPKFATNYIEGIVCHNHDISITSDQLEEFFKTAKRMCSDPEARVQVSNELRRCVIAVEQFNSELNFLLENATTDRLFQTDVKIDYDALSEMYLEIENRFQPQMQFFLVRRYRLRSAFLFPKLFIKSLGVITRKIMKKYTAGNP